MADVNIPWFAAPTNIASGVADADKAAYQAQAAGTEARGKAYDLKLKQTVEALMAHATGPNGVDQKKFYELAAGTPFGVSAIKAYADTVFPQKQKEREHSAALAVLDPSGSVGGAETARAMQEDPSTAGTTLSTAMGLQKTQFANAAEAAKNKATVLSLFPGAWASQPTTKPTSAQPGSIGGNAGMQVTLPTATGAGYKGDFSVDQYAKMSPQDQEAFRRGMTGAVDELDNPISDKSSPASLASAMRRVQAMQYAAGNPGVDPRDPLASVEKSGANLNAAPATGLKAIQDVIQRGYQLKGTNISQKGGELSNVGSGQGIENTGRTMKIAKEFNGRGFDGVTPSNVPDAQRLQGEVASIHSSAEQAKTLASDPKSVAELSDDDFGFMVYNIMKNLKNADDIKTISDDAHMSGFIRPGASLGKVLSESDGPMEFIKGAFRTNLSKTDRIPLLRSIQQAAEAAELHGIARSKMEGAYGAGKMPWEVHWSKKTTGGGKYTETKTNSAGMKMGRKSDGTWEPIR